MRDVICGTGTTPRSTNGSNHHTIGELSCRRLNRFIAKLTGGRPADADTQRLAAAPGGRAAPAGPVVLDRGDDHAGAPRIAERHHDLVEHDIVQHLMAGPAIPPAKRRETARCSTPRLSDMAAGCKFPDAVGAWLLPIDQNEQKLEKETGT